MKKIRIFAICAITCIVFMICLFKNPYFIFILENINYNHISGKKVINSYTSNKKTFIGIAGFAQNDINDLWINSEKDKQFSVTKVEVGKNTLMEIHNEKLSKQLIVSYY